MRYRMIVWSVVLALGIVAGLGICSWWSAQKLLEETRWVTHTHEVIEALERMVSSIKDVQRAVRGFAITPNEGFLLPYDQGIRNATSEMQTVRQLTIDNQLQRSRLDQLEPKIKDELKAWAHILDLLKNGSANGAIELFRSGLTNQQMNEIVDDARRMIQTESDLLNERDAVARETARSTRWINLIGFSFSFLLLSVAGLIVRHQITLLDSTVSRLEAQSAENRILSEMGEMLQSCTAAWESYAVIGTYMPRLAPLSSGALFLMADSKDVAEPVSNWGNRPTDAVIDINQCWGLKRGSLHETSQHNRTPRCLHIQPGAIADTYLCLPLMAQGEAIGVLHVVLPQTPKPNDGYIELLKNVADHLSGALAAMKLRDKLMNQAIRDGLTGLFNRRYMQETLEREVRRSQRKNLPLAVMMLDLDHFKRFNDTFGHGAGDALLRDVGAAIKSQVRTEDVACRYGGEEFAIILTDSSVENAMLRAEDIRGKIRNLKVSHHGQLLGTVTVSIGIAGFPSDATDSLAILSAADRCLYKAKELGRDRVVTTARSGATS